MVQSTQYKWTLDLRHADSPADFQRIPLEHPRSRVLASVPDSKAAEAVLLAQVPQIARVNKNEIKAPDVVYQAIRSTRVSRARNSIAR